MRKLIVRLDVERAVGGRALEAVEVGRAGREAARGAGDGRCGAPPAMSMSIAMRPNVSSVPNTTEHAAGIVVLTVIVAAVPAGVQLHARLPGGDGREVREVTGSTAGDAAAAGDWAATGRAGPATGTSRSVASSRGSRARMRANVAPPSARLRTVTRPSGHPAHPAHPPLRALAPLVLTMVLWGSAFSVSSLALDHVGPPVGRGHALQLRGRA